MRGAMSGIAVMRERITVIIAIALLLLVAGTSYWYSANLRRPDPLAQPALGSPDVIVDQLVLTQFDAQGRARNRLYAEKLSHLPDNDDIEVVAPRLVSLRPDQPRVEVSARTARLENAAERVYLHDNVLLTRAAFAAEPPMSVVAVDLLVLPDDDKYQSDQPVTITHGISSSSANSMIYDNIARTLDMAGAVQTIFRPEPERPPQIKPASDIKRKVSPVKKVDDAARRPKDKAQRPRQTKKGNKHRPTPRSARAVG
jgi:lipopolysaccharide export system protein LptC